MRITDEDIAAVEALSAWHARQGDREEIIDLVDDIIEATQDRNFLKVAKLRAEIKDKIERLG